MISAMWSSRVFVVVICAVSVCVVSGSRVKRIVGGEPAESPPAPPKGVSSSPYKEPTTTLKPVLTVKKHWRKAEITGVPNKDGTYSFLGIRYAEPPVGKNRFRRPRRVKLQGQVDARKFPPPCPQPYKKGFIGNEDCLFVNVHIPKLPAKGQQDFPVVFWIHGGNYRTGSASQYNPTRLVQKGVVVVIPQYRLGSLGFLSTGKKDLPGNSGMFDLISALRWTHDYIHKFGGNPGRITAAGHGSGASAATMLTLNPASKRMVKGVIAMSGTAVSPFAVDKGEQKTAQEVGSSDGCGDKQDKEFVECMQNLSAEDIIKGDDSVQNKNEKEDGFSGGLADSLLAPNEEGPNDDRFVPSALIMAPLEAIKGGLFPPDIPLLTGVTSHETGSGVRGKFFSEISNKIKNQGFLQKNLFSNLLTANKGLYSNKTVNPRLKSLFENGEYTKFFDSAMSFVNKAISGLGKVIKATTDAFFNLPAFIQSTLWSKKNPVYLYSTEHKPQVSQASGFLGESPLVGPPAPSAPDKKGPEHGDDLMYLFDLNDIDGTPLDRPAALEEGDEKLMCDHYVQMVAEFARTGVPKVGSKTWKPFNEKENNYMVLKGEPKEAKNFHKCSMGLWTGEAGLLESPECSFLGEPVKQIQNTVGTVSSTLLKPVNLTGFDKLGGNLQRAAGSLTKQVKIPPALTQGANQLASSVGLGGLLQPNKASTTPAPGSSTTKKKGILGLG